MKEIKFPKKIHFRRIHPLVSFFQQCAKRAEINCGKNLLTPWAFEINPADSGILKSLIRKYYEAKKAPKSKIDFMCENDWLKHGPKENSSVKKGFVYVDEINAVKRDN